MVFRSLKASKSPRQEEILQERPDFKDYPMMLELVKQAGEARLALA